MARLQREREGGGGEGQGEGGGEGQGEGGGLGRIQLKLEPQLEEAEDEMTVGCGHGGFGVSGASLLHPTPPVHTRTAQCHTPSHFPKSTVLPPSHPLTTHPLEYATSGPLSFYHEEPELCGVVWRTDGGYRGERLACPLAHLLEQCYMTPVTNASREDTLYS